MFRGPYECKIIFSSDMNYPQTPPFLLASINFCTCHLVAILGPYMYRLYALFIFLQKIR